MLPKLLVFSVFFYCAKCSEENPSIIIIGSGPSGIAAATRLLEHNLTNIKILEAEDRIGGRIHSVQFGDAIVDLGAEFCHGEEDNVVYSLAKDFNILKHPNIQDRLEYSSGEQVRDDVANDILHFAEKMEMNETTSPPLDKDSKKPLSVVDFFENVYNSTILKKYQDDPKTAEIVWAGRHTVELAVEVYNSVLDWNDLLLRSKFLTSKGDHLLNWDGHGYKTILEIMMKKFPTKENALPIDDKILVNKEVVKINWDDGDKIKVECKDDSTYTADHVISTVSVGVLKATHETLFNPKLPAEKIDAIERIGFGAIMKVILHFPERWWDNDTTWVFLWSPEDREKIIKDGREWILSFSALAPAENNPNVFIAWFAGSEIPKIEKLSDEILIDGIMATVDKFLQKKFKITKPDKFLRTSWYSNPHFRGTYSYESVKGHSNGGDDFPVKLASSLKDKNGKEALLFAGEATNLHHYSTVHGAIESGYRAADILISKYK